MSIMTGTSCGLFYTSLMSGVSFIYRDVLDKAIGILKAHIGIGMVFGLLVGSGTYTLGGFPLTCYLMALLAAIGSFLIRLCIPANVSSPTRKQEDQLHPLISDTLKEIHHSGRDNHSQELREQLRQVSSLELLGCKQFWFGLCISLFYAFVSSGLLATFSVRYEDYHIDRAWFGLLILVYLFP